MARRAAPLRDALAKAFVRGPQTFGASLDPVERAADRAGLALDGFFEAAVRAMLDVSPMSALYCESLDQLKAVAAFLRALERAPLDRAAAIRGAMKVEDDDERHAALAAWVRKKKPSRAIERE